MSSTQYRSPKSISIILKPGEAKDIKAMLSELTNLLIKHKCNIMFNERESMRVNAIVHTSSAITFVPESVLYNEPDLIITLGGDGTLIGTCRKMSNRQIPILGVNMGHLGFITEFSEADYLDAVVNCLNKKYSIIKQKLYCVEIIKNEKNRIKSFFLNDAVLNKNDISRMFTLKVSSNDEHIYDLSGDGLIVSSPIGSTAYSLAAGGPIIHPDVNAVILTPICPHSLTHRPLVVPNNATITISIPETTQLITLTLDGQLAVHVKQTEKINISCCKKKFVLLVQNPKRTYFDTLKTKFFHGKRENRYAKSQK